MYAIVEIAGKQYKVHENDNLVVPRLSGDVDDTVTFDRVLLVANDDDVQLGTPVVPDATVTATIVEHVKGDKVLVFRKKRRKRFKVKRGHRQPYTRIEVSELSVGDNGRKATKSSKPTAKTSAESKVDDKAESTAEAETATTAPTEPADAGTEVAAIEESQEEGTSEAKGAEGDEKAAKASKAEQAEPDESSDEATDEASESSDEADKEKTA